MSTASRKIQRRAAELVAPLVEDLGLALVDVEYSRHGGTQLLRVFLERDGGVTVDELQEASRSIEKNLEVEEILQGRYRLEVSSPGLDRPLKRPADFAKHVGERVKLKVVPAVPGASLRLSGTLAAAGPESVTIETDEGPVHTVPYVDIASAGPEIDWEALLRKPAKSKKRARKKAGGAP